MKPIALALLIVSMGAVVSSADESAGTTGQKAGTVSKTQDLVDASKGAKARRKKSTGKVITNADVKRSKGKIVQTTLPPLAVEEPPPGTMMERHEAAKKVNAEAAARLAAVQQNVAELEKELLALEQQYYEENDLQRRDRVIVPQFNEVRRKLDAARGELESLTPGESPDAGGSLSAGSRLGEQRRK
jgi:hypothetical protein